MRLFFFGIFILFSTTAFSQLNRDTVSYRISQKTLDSFKYHVEYMKKSPQFKVTCRTAFDRDALSQLVSEDNLTQMFDDIEFSQFLKYNVRARWRFKNKNSIFMGAETMGANAPGPGQNAYYIGFKKRF
jgi:hypothetical protein